MLVAQHPPHRSPRAEFPHGAPTLDEWRRNARVEKDVGHAEPESSAGQEVGIDPKSFALLTATPKRLPPVARHLFSKPSHAASVTRNRVVVEVEFARLNWPTLIV